MRNQERRKETAKDIAREGMRLINCGKVRNHKLRNSSRVHTGEVEKMECDMFRDFLPSKNGCMVYGLTGSNIYD